MSNNDEKLFNTRQIAAQLGVTPRRVRYLVEKTEITPKKQYPASEVALINLAHGVHRVHLPVSKPAELKVGGLPKDGVPLIDPVKQAAQALADLPQLKSQVPSEIMSLDTVMERMGNSDDHLHRPILPLTRPVMAPGTTKTTHYITVTASFGPGLDIRGHVPYDKLPALIALLET